jgi:hypothetical protein
MIMANSQPEIPSTHSQGPTIEMTSDRLLDRVWKFGCSWKNSFRHQVLFFFVMQLPGLSLITAPASPDHEGERQGVRL